MAHRSSQALTPWAAACPLMKKAPSRAANSAMILGKVIRSFRKSGENRITSADPV